MTQALSLRLAEAVDSLELAGRRRHDSATVSVSADDIDIVLRRLEALEGFSLDVRKRFGELPEDALGYLPGQGPDGRPQAIRDLELETIDHVVSSGLSAAGRLRTAVVAEAQFDVMAPLQEELAIQFCNEIGHARDKGLSIDAVRLLEMARELYLAEILEQGADAHEETLGAAAGRQALRQAARAEMPDSLSALIGKIVHLVDALDADIVRLRRLDEEYRRIESWIVLNTDFDRYDGSYDTAGRLIRSLERIKAGNARKGNAS